MCVRYRLRGLSREKRIDWYRLRLATLSCNLCECADSHHPWTVEAQTAASRSWILKSPKRYFLLDEAKTHSAPSQLEPSGKLYKVHSKSEHRGP